MKTNVSDKVDLLLSKLDRREIDEFIKKECADDRTFRERFLALGAGTVFKPTPAVYKSRIRELMRDYGDRYGFISYGRTFAFSGDLHSIIEEEEEAVMERQWDVAVAILTAVADMSENIIERSDDSGGELGFIVDTCFKNWLELCKEEGLPEKTKAEIFKTAMAHFAKRHLRGWDWWWKWMEIAISLADTGEKQGRVMKAVDDVINAKNSKKDEDEGYNPESEAETAQKYRLEMMSKTGTEEEQRKFLYDNAGNPDFRKRLLQMAWDGGDYDEVLRLAKEGLQHDKDRLGLIYRWHTWEYDVYKQRKDNANMMKTAPYFFFHNGFLDSPKELSMENIYTLMKAIAPDEEWESHLDMLINEALRLDQRTQLLYIYTREKMWDRYIEFLRRHPSLRNLEEAPAEVRQSYKDEFIRLYGGSISESFQRVGDRDAYREGVQRLRKLIGYGGKAEADRIVAGLKAIKPRRPALLDELSKL